IRQEPRLGAVRGNNLEAQSPLPPEHDGDTASVRRHRRRLEKRSFACFPDLQRLPILEAPKSVASAQRGQIEEGCSANARGQGAYGWEGQGFFVIFPGEAVQNGYGPNSGAGICNSRDESPSVGACRHG